MAWMIDGNRLKEKAVSLLFPTEMETCGHLPTPVQAVTVSTIEDMVYREGVEVVRCKDCKHWKILDDSSFVCRACARTTKLQNPYDFCSYGERREAE